MRHGTYSEHNDWKADSKTKHNHPESRDTQHK